MAECQQNLANYPAGDRTLREVPQGSFAPGGIRTDSFHAKTALDYDLDLPSEDPDHSEPVIEASFRLGECRLAEGSQKVARRVWQDLLAEVRRSPDPDRIADAQFQLARTWNIPKPQSDEELNLGVSALRAFIERFPKHKLASQAHLEIAESYVERGRYADAAAALRQFLADPQYQGREEIPVARNLLGRCLPIAEEVSRGDRSVARLPGQVSLRPAVEQRAAGDHQHRVPDGRREAGGQAIRRRQPVVRRVPGEISARRARARHPAADEPQGRRGREMGRGHRRRGGGSSRSIPIPTRLRRPSSTIAETLEKKLGKLEEALEEYRKTTKGHCAAAAQQAIARLTATSMTVATERVFRSDETPKLKLVSRNVESVTVRAYKVDLETYFRKMHLARGVEGLDISLIDPDKTFEFKVPELREASGIGERDRGAAARRRRRRA